LLGGRAAGALCALRGVMLLAVRSLGRSGTGGGLVGREVGAFFGLEDAGVSDSGEVALRGTRRSNDLMC
jgi:hypothetical protein